MGMNDQHIGFYSRTCYFCFTLESTKTLLYSLSVKDLKFSKYFKYNQNYSWFRLWTQKAFILLTASLSWWLHHVLYFLSCKLTELILSVQWQWICLSYFLPLTNLIRTDVQTRAWIALIQHRKLLHIPDFHDDMIGGIELSENSMWTSK